MAKKSESESVERKSRSGPRAPEGKAPLQILVKEKTIEGAKLRVIREKTSVSAVVEALLQGWLDGTIKLPDEAKGR